MRTEAKEQAAGSTIRPFLAMTDSPVSRECRIAANDPTKLRQIADWLDKVDEILPLVLQKWQELPQDARDFFAGAEMQADLRRIADTIDTLTAERDEAAAFRALDDWKQATGFGLLQAELQRLREALREVSRLAYEYKGADLSEELIRGPLSHTEGGE